MENFSEIIQGEKPVLVDFFAKWCGPCKMMGSILEELKKELGDRITVIKIDIDAPRNQELSVTHSIRSVPTLLLFMDGKIVWRHSGVIRTDEIRSIVEHHLEAVQA